MPDPVSPDLSPVVPGDSIPTPATAQVPTNDARLALAADSESALLPDQALDEIAGGYYKSYNRS